MKKIIGYLVCVLLLLCILSGIISCDRSDIDAVESEVEGSYSMPEYDPESIGSYISPFVYVGLGVYAEAGETAQEALWSDIVESVEIIEYPSAQVEYYASQERAKYRYFARRDGIEYEELLSALGVTEESMTARAKSLVKEDLALQFIIYDAGITLTSEEKAVHTDKYAEKLSQIYGNDAEYIKTNMTEQIYDAMLSDKTMEYLLANNTVYTTQSE